MTRLSLVSCRCSINSIPGTVHAAVKEKDYMLHPYQKC